MLVVFFGLLGVALSNSLGSLAGTLAQTQTFTFFTDAECANEREEKTDTFTEPFNQGDILFYRANGL